MHLVGQAEDGLEAFCEISEKLLLRGFCGICVPFRPAIGFSSLFLDVVQRRAMSLFTAGYSCLPPCRAKTAG